MNIAIEYCHGIEYHNCHAIFNDNFHINIAMEYLILNIAMQFSTFNIHMKIAMQFSGEYCH